MASFGIRVICEILASRVLPAARKAGLNASHFRTITEREVYKTIEEHYSAALTCRQYPSADSIKKKHPSFDWVDIQQDRGQIETLVQDLKNECLEGELVTVSSNFVDMVNHGDIHKAIDYIQGTLPKLMNFSHGKSGGFSLGEILEGVVQSYEGAVTGSGQGIPWIWPCLTEDTMGKRPGDFIVLYGRMKSMKTWLILASAVHDFMDYNQRVLVWSREMSPEQMKLRSGAIFAGVDYQMLKRGMLPGTKFSESVDRLRMLRDEIEVNEEERAIRTRKGLRDFVVLSGRDAPQSVAELSSAIEQYQPTVVYVDSFYHLRSQRSEGEKQLWAKIQMLAEDLKEAAVTTKVPIVAAAQANRSGEKLAGSDLTEVAGSDAIAREADLIMRVLRKVTPALNEDDYEGYWKEEVLRNKERIDARVFPGRGIYTSWKDVPKRGLRPVEEVPVRTGAQICLVLGGNREGTLEAFQLDCVPGYRFDVTKDRVSRKEISAWLKEDVDRGIEEEMKGTKIAEERKKQVAIGAFRDHRKGTVTVPQKAKVVATTNKNRGVER